MLDTYICFFNLFFIIQISSTIRHLCSNKEQFLILFVSGIPISILSSFFLYALDSDALAIGYSSIAFFALGFILRFMIIKIIISNLIFLGIFHAVVLYFDLPIFWQGHLVGFLLGNLYFQIIKSYPQLRI